jgi:Fur family peroxide stress response transcriptional regulator
VLANSHDHPTAEDVFERSRAQMPDISFATVYNCLSVLVQCGLVRQVILDKSPARFCPNMREHYHFYCEKCGQVTDIDSAAEAPKIPLPAGYKVSNYDFSMRGLCAECGEATLQ